MSLGIYFGPKEISIVESKGKKFSKQAKISQPVGAGVDLEDKVPAEVKLIEMVAQFKDELRKNRIDAKDASLCLSGNDLIIRTFEMPQLPREELQSAILFEAKKYIPFKVEELVTDFQIEQDKASRTNLVLFIGIKKDTLEKYMSLLEQVGIKVSGLEYSAFSLLRSLKLANLSDAGVVGVIGADMLAEDEINFTVTENGFPLFSRDISLGGGPEEAGRVGAKEPGMVLEKLKTEIRISLDYYNRKFSSKAIKKMYLFCNDDYRAELEAYITQVGPMVQFVDVSRAIEGVPFYSLSFLKAFGASLAKTIKTNIKVNLLAVKEKVAPSIGKEKIPAMEAAPLFEGIKIDFKMVVLGLVICAATYAYGIYRQQPVKKAIDEVIAARPKVAIVSADATYEILTAKEAEFTKKLSNLNDLIKKQLFLTTPLNSIPKAIPKGVWLVRFNFDKKDKDRSDLTMDGASYLANDTEERNAVNQFVTNLKSNADFNKNFKTVSLTSIDRRQTGKITATNFSISCKTY